MYHLSEDPEVQKIVLSWFERMINALANKMYVPGDILAGALIEGERRKRKEEELSTHCRCRECGEFFKYDPYTYYDESTGEFYMGGMTICPECYQEMCRKEELNESSS